MALKDVVKVSRKTFFNPRGWLGYDTLKASSQGLWVILKEVFTIPQPTRRETFAEAMQRLNLTEQDLQQTGQRYFLLAMLFVGLGGAAFLGGFYMLFYHQTFAGLVLAMATSAVFFSQAFRYHFWYFQIKHRKLGCTFLEWRQGKINEREESQP